MEAPGRGTPEGWFADPRRPGIFRHWSGWRWDCAGLQIRPSDPELYVWRPPYDEWLSWLELDGWVDVKKSTVPGVVSGSPKRNWYGFFVSPDTGDLTVIRGAHPLGIPVALRGVESIHLADGTYSIEASWASRTVRRRPSWAVTWGVILTFLALLGLLLFLIKEDQEEHYWLLTVTGVDGTAFSGEYRRTTVEPIYRSGRYRRPQKNWYVLPKG